MKKPEFEDGPVRKDARFINIILSISLLAVLILPLYVVYFLTPAFSEFILEDTERRLISVAERMADSLDTHGVISYASITPQFVKRLEDIRNSIALQKVKVFTVDGTIVYCTDPKLIGEKSKQDFFPDVVKSGYPRSYIKNKELPTVLGIKNTHQIIETYVPIISDNFDVVGVFEIYYDLTTTNKELIKLTHRAYFVLLVIVLVLLGAVLLSVSRTKANMRKRELAELEVRRQKGLLEQQNIELARLHEQAQALSLQDHLTGLGNRRLLEILFERTFALAHRYDKELALIMLDVDHFKDYNDTNGHQAGDQALVTLAAIIRAQLRETDLAFRYGGEEFLLLLPEIDRETGLLVAEKLRLAVATESPVTISLGVTSYHTGSTIDGMIREADEALYQAKAGGRNRVVGTQPA